MNRIPTPKRRWATPLLRALQVVLLLALTLSCTPGVLEIERPQGVIAAKGMVVAGHPEATRIGVSILEKGGNAFDAAVAVHFALAVAYPGAGNIGGGGFAVYRISNGEIGCLDFREKAPYAASRDMYLSENGEIIPRRSLDGHLAAGVPGSVDGMVSLHERLGSLPFSELVQPAIDLARAGVVLTEREAKKLNRHREKFLQVNSAHPYLVKPNGTWRTGEKLSHPDFAATLERIRDHSREGFYAGETAALIIREMERGGGILTRQDLIDYSPVWRHPVTGIYKGYRIISMPPPSSGGIALVQLLKGIEPYPVNNWGFARARTIHLMTELERRVYADRSTWLGDADFYPVPVTTLLDNRYIANRMSDIDLERKTDSAAVSPGKPRDLESTETTHFSIVDRRGNAVSVTTTLNSSFGSKVVVAGGGFLLNNEMDDFSIKQGAANQFGLIGSEANAIEPGKRMLSSMTPTIVEKEGRLFMVLGTPGGSTIITSVFQVLLNVIEHGMTGQEAVRAGRVHHQWLPDKISFEEGGTPQEVQQELTAMGHRLEPRSRWGKVNAIRVLSDGRLEGAADTTRGDDTAMGY